MDYEQLHLVKASELSEDAFDAMIRDYLHEGTPFLGMFSRADYYPFLRICKLHSQGLNLPRGVSPYTRYFLVDDKGTVYAQGDVRHAPTVSLTLYEGYIGYGVLPSKRRKGIGTVMCAKLKEMAATYGYSSIIVTCRTDNEGSKKIIERNGGELLDIRFWKKRSQYMRRYRIVL